MHRLDAILTRQALEATGETLVRHGCLSRVHLIIAGGTAGLLAGSLRASRVTADCDVMWHGDESTWKAVSDAAKEVADLLELPATWLNRDCSMYAWCLPLGWQSRCEPVGTFGPLQVSRIARIDLMAAKVMGAPVRPQDVEDLQDMRPTREELTKLAEHLDRLEMEDLDGTKYEDQRAILESLRNEQ
jgi:hypothetical protein